MFDGIVKNKELDRVRKTESGHVEFLREEEEEEKRFAFFKALYLTIGLTVLHKHLLV